jgi:hypothetical protein
MEHRGVKVDEKWIKAEELARERMISDFTAKAAEAYSKILTRYPVMYRSDDAKARLQALHQPVPRPTKAALAQNKMEEAGRSEQTMLSRMMGTVGRHPDVSPATKVGDPTLVDPTPVSASGIVQQANRVAVGAKPSDSHSLSLQTTGTGTPAENEPAPRSDTPAASETAPPAADQNQQAAQPDPNELTPNPAAADPKISQPTASAADPNELKPNVAQDAQPAPAPTQVNEIQQPSGGNGTAVPAPIGTASSSSQELADDKAIASSKQKKKKGLRRVIPFN